MLLVVVVVVLVVGGCGVNSGGVSVSGGWLCC